MKVITSTSARTYYFEDGKQVFPCRCGQIHSGDYGSYDYAHHNCYHHEFMRLAEEWPEDIICLQCGFVTYYSGSLPPFRKQ